MNLLQTIKNKINFILFGIFLIAGLIGCYKEYIVYPDPGTNNFNFLVTLEQEELIIESRGQKHLITDPDPVLMYNDKEYAIDRFQLRGATTLNFHRKSYSVNLDKNLTYFVEEENSERDFEKFKLISMVYDYTYIEQGIAHEIMRKLDLWSLFTFYTEVKLNNNTQGLYLFIEDPEDYYLYQRNSPVIMRRDYHNYIIDYELNEFLPTQSFDHYNNRFNHIYDLIVNYSGRQLYDSLVHHIDIEEYCRKIAVDMLLQNGDYTDEVYFYLKEKDGREIFGVVPWDYDDIFNEQPHEIGRTWGPGTMFGTRTYNSMDDVYADVGHKLLFSIEDDLDYKIAIDSVLYQVYLEELVKVLETIDNTVISEIFTKVRNVLRSFYDRPEIIEQSQYDNQATSMELFEMNIIDKEQLILERRTWLLNKLYQE